MSPSGSSYNATQPQGMVGSSFGGTSENGQRMSGSPDLRKNNQQSTSSAQSAQSAQPPTMSAPPRMSRNGAMAETSAMNGDTSRMAGQTAQAVNPVNTPGQRRSGTQQKNPHQSQEGKAVSRPESMTRATAPQMQMMDTGRPASSMLSRDGSADKKNSGRGDRRRRD